MTTSVPPDFALALRVSNFSPVITDPAEEYPITPTFIGQVDTNVGVFHPCKYEEIRLAPVPETDKDKASIIFNRETAGPETLIIPIICAGLEQMSDYTLTLLQLDTRECRFGNDGQNHTGRSLRARTPPANFRVEGAGDGTTLPFKAGVRYPAATVNAEYGMVQMLPFIWPARLPDGHDTPLVVDAETCRYDKEVRILAYPNVVWVLDFRFGLAGPVQSTHTNLPTYDRGGGENGRTNSRRSQAQSGAISAGHRNSYGLGRRPNGLDLEFQLVLEAEYNKGEKIELAAKYAAKIKRALELLLTIKEKVDEFMHIDKVREGQRDLVSRMSRRLRRAPMTGTLDYPVISIGGKRQAAVNTENNTVYTDGKLILRLNPLMKAEISMDLVAAASYVPAWGTAVKAVEATLEVMGTQLNFLLTLFGVVNVAGEYAFADSGGSSLSVDGEIGLKLVLSATVRVNMNAVLFEVDGEIKAEGYAVTSFKPKVGVGHDEGGMFLDAKVEWTGLKIVCTFVATANGRTIQTDETIPVIDGKEIGVKPYIISK